MKEERREFKIFKNFFGDMSPNPTGITYISVFDRPWLKFIIESLIILYKDWCDFKILIENNPYNGSPYIEGLFVTI